MNMAFATSLYPATGKRPIFKIIKPFTRNAATRRNFTVRRNFSCSATVVTDITARVSEFDIENQKNDLLRLVQDTQRGLVTTPDQRSCIEEALVCLFRFFFSFFLWDNFCLPSPCLHCKEKVSLEGYTRGESVDLVPLDGTWRLQYTSASDVLVLFESAARFPFFQVVGQIFQKFECRDQSDGGVIRNVVKWSIPTLLEVNCISFVHCIPSLCFNSGSETAIPTNIIFVNRFLDLLSSTQISESIDSLLFLASFDENPLEQEGATLLVSAKFNVVSARNIYLQFEEISIQNIRISKELQALVAPALLPRSFLSLQILQFIRTFKAQIPVRNPGDPGRRSVGGLYYLSYLDHNMLLGRAVGGGGVFVFTRAQPFDL
ncbi:hypothetical protein DKX38_003031 [Salix brachista]|uniref:Plastid lipid-associated protein/fibrillin conserved domain-containing protein n=1 Tax=Salix brachista TaxID=2182728 RepID=A0A5N5NQK3_9ROSI|nr:hypothetical protein DKX38_003031 [Salix brachista]